MKVKRGISFILMLCVMVPLLSFAKTDVSAASAIPEHNKIYYLKNVNSGKYMDASGAVSGANIRQNGYTGSDYQRFRLVLAWGSGANAYYMLVPMCNSSLRVDVQNMSTSNGTNIQLFVDNSQAYPGAQLFRFTLNSNGSYRITPKCCIDAGGLASGRAVGVDGSSTANNANVELCNYALSTSSKQWELVTAVEYIYFTNNTVTLEKGTTSSSPADRLRFYPANAANKSVTWTSSDPDCVSVNGSGVITAHHYSKVIITARTADGGKLASFCVDVSDIPNVPVYAQQTSTTCGCASVRMILAYYNIYKTEAEIKDKANERAGVIGGDYTYVSVLTATLNSYLDSTYQYKYKKFPSGSQEDYGYFCGLHCLFDVPIQLQLSINNTNYFPYTADHYVVLRGLKQTPDGQSYLGRVNDPHYDYWGIYEVPLSALYTYNLAHSGYVIGNKEMIDLYF